MIYFNRHRDMHVGQKSFWSHLTITASSTYLLRPLHAHTTEMKLQIDILLSELSACQIDQVPNYEFS